MANYKHPINASKWQLASQLEAQGWAIVEQCKNQWTLRDGDGNEAEITVKAHRDGRQADYVIA